LIELTFGSSHGAVVAADKPREAIADSDITELKINFLMELSIRVFMFVIG
jgi:hypothetical protein